MKVGIRLHCSAVIDDIWYTCCAFHNMLLDVDGLSNSWQNGVSSAYEGEFGLHEAGEVELRVPAALRRLGVPFCNRSHDTSVIGYHENTNWVNVEATETVVNGIQSVYSVRRLSLKIFSIILVDHFDYLWRHHRVVWPSRQLNS